jgi:hypothetical protein
MTESYPVPPPELVEQWLSEHYGAVSVAPGAATSHVATKAAKWGADQELEACCEWVRIFPHYCQPTHFIGLDGHRALRLARRPEPLSLKEQALALVSHDFSDQPCLSEEGYALIRRALEQLDD